MRLLKFISGVIFAAILLSILLIFGLAFGIVFGGIVGLIAGYNAWDVAINRLNKVNYKVSV